MSDNLERATLARFLLGGELTGDEAALLASALIPGSMPPVDRPFEALIEDRLPGGTPYRIKAVQLVPGESIGFAIEGHGGTSVPWLIKREHLVRMLQICDGELAP